MQRHSFCLVVFPTVKGSSVQAMKTFHNLWEIIEERRYNQLSNATAMKTHFTHDRFHCIRTLDKDEGDLQDKTLASPGNAKEEFFSFMS